MTSLNTQTRKFLFFDEVKETPEKNITKKNKKEEKKEKENKEKEKLNISVSSIVPTKGLQCLDEVLFLCGTVFYKEMEKNKEQKKKKDRILKLML